MVFVPSDALRDLSNSTLACSRWHGLSIRFVVLIGDDRSLLVIASHSLRLLRGVLMLMEEIALAVGNLVLLL